MANPAKKTAAPVAKQKTVKTKGVKIRAIQDVKLFFSDKNTRPLNDVSMVIHGEPYIKEGLTEEEKIAEGSQYPYRKKISFEKTKNEREKWKKFHTNEKLEGNWGSGEPKNVLKHTLVVHYINNNKADANFVSTRSFKNVALHEVREAIKSTVKLKDNTDSPFNYISKYYFAGKRYVVRNGKAEQE